MERHTEERLVWSFSHLAPPDARKKSKRTGYNHILAAHPFSTLSPGKSIHGTEEQEKRKEYISPFPGPQLTTQMFTSLYDPVLCEIKSDSFFCTQGALWKDKLKGTERNKWGQNCTSYLVYTHRVRKN
jgi:hypothetical protein